MLGFSDLDKRVQEIDSKSEGRCGVGTNPDDDGGGGGGCGAGIWLVLGGRALELPPVLWPSVPGGRCVVLVLLCFLGECSVGTVLCLPAESAIGTRSLASRVSILIPLACLVDGRCVVLLLLCFFGECPAGTVLCLPD